MISHDGGAGGAISFENRMTIDERRRCLTRMQERYLQAGRRERVQLLDEMEAITELHRNGLIGLSRDNPTRRPCRRLRGRAHGADVDDTVRVISETTSPICAKRLTPSLPRPARYLQIHGERTTSPQLLEQLERDQRVYGRADREPTPAR